MATEAALCCQVIEDNMYMVHMHDLYVSHRHSLYNNWWLLAQIRKYNHSNKNISGQYLP